MSKRLFQSLAIQMKEATGRMVGVIDSLGVIVACSEVPRIDSEWKAAVEEIKKASAEIVIFEECTFQKMATWSNSRGYCVFVEGTGDAAAVVCRMAAIAMNSVKTNQSDKQDNLAFVKNVLLDNILPGDIYMRGRELHFDVSCPRAVLLVRQLSTPDSGVLDVVQGLFPDRQHDFVISMNESELVLVKEVVGDVSAESLNALATEIEDTIKSELMVSTVIGIGTVAGHLKDLAPSYKEAQVAIDVGKVFEVEKTIINYENLGIGRLIYQLPTTMCEMFLAEVFKKGTVEALDKETLDTIQKFFENSLNVSETSRKLFVHRNTLVYRLERIKKITGLDLREFDHAITFKVALMVNKYLSSRETGY